jgi:hypothetical protein
MEPFDAGIIFPSIADLLLLGLQLLRKQIKDVFLIFLTISMPLIIIRVIIFPSLFLRLVIGILMDFSAIAIIFVIVGELENRPITWWNAIKLSAIKYIDVFAAIIYANLSIVIFSILFIIPGMILSVLLVFTMQAVVLRNLKQNIALTYSQRLIGGHWWRTLSYLLIIVLPVVILNLFLYIDPINLAINPLLNISIQILEQFLGIFTTTTLTILFLNLEGEKSRQGLTVEKMIHNASNLNRQSFTENQKKEE